MTTYPDSDRLDFHDFHLQLLPTLLANGNGQRAAEAARELAPLCVRLAESDDAYTYVPAADTIAVVAGTEAEVVIELDEASWRRWVDEHSSPLIADQQMVYDSGCGDNDRWHIVLTAMFYPFTASQTD